MRVRIRSLALLACGVLVGAQVPCVDQVALSRIDLALLPNILNADPQAVLGEDDILLAHFLRDFTTHLGNA